MPSIQPTAEATADATPAEAIKALVTAHEEQSKTLKSDWDVENTEPRPNNKKFKDGIDVGLKYQRQVGEVARAELASEAYGSEKKKKAVEGAKTWLKDVGGYQRKWVEKMEEEEEQKQIYVNANENEIKLMIEKGKEAAAEALNLKNEGDAEEWKGSRWGERTAAKDAYTKSLTILEDIAKTFNDMANLVEHIKEKALAKAVSEALEGAVGVATAAITTARVTADTEFKGIEDGSVSAKEIATDLRKVGNAGKDALWVVDKYNNHEDLQAAVKEALDGADRMEDRISFFEYSDISEGQVTLRLNKIDALANKIRSVLQDDADDPALSDIIAESKKYVMFKVVQNVYLRCSDKRDDDVDGDYVKVWNNEVLGAGTWLRSSQAALVAVRAG